MLGCANVHLVQYFLYWCGQKQRARKNTVIKLMRGTYNDISLMHSPRLQHSVARTHFVLNSPWMNSSPINLSSCFLSVCKLLTSSISCDSKFCSSNMCCEFINWHLIILLDILSYLWEMMNIIFIVTFWKLESSITFAVSLVLALIFSGQDRFLYSVQKQILPFAKCGLINNEDINWLQLIWNKRKIRKRKIKHKGEHLLFRPQMQLDQCIENIKIGVWTLQCYLSVKSKHSCTISIPQG